MKAKKWISGALVAVAFMAMSLTQAMAAQNDKTREMINMDLQDVMKSSVFPVGGENTQYAKYFDGKSYLHMLSLEQVVIGWKSNFALDAFPARKRRKVC